MSTPVPIIGRYTPDKPSILVVENDLWIAKPKEHTIVIKHNSCITFTEHTPDGDITHTGIIISIDTGIDFRLSRGNGLIRCRVNDSIKEIGITPATYDKNGNDWSTIKNCAYKYKSNYISNTGLDPLGDMKFRNAGTYTSNTGLDPLAFKPFRNAGGKRRRRTRQARRRKNRRTRSRK